jgi:MFS family permease
MGGNRQYVGLVVLLITANMTQFGARVVISPVIPQIIDTFDVTKGVIGLALTGMWASYALMQFPSGVLGDKFGERKIVLASLGLTALGSTLLAIAPNYPVFLIFAICLGAGSGLYFTVATVYMSKVFDKHGQIFGIHSAGGPLAGLIGPVIAAYVGLHFGWRSAVFLGTLSAVPVGVLFMLRTSPSPPERPDSSLVRRLKSNQSLGILLRPPLTFTTFLAAIGYFKWQSFASFFPTFLIEYRDIPSGDASLIFGIVFAIAVLGLPAFGRISDYTNRDAVLVFGFLAGAVGYVVFLSMPIGNLVFLAAGTLSIGFGMSWGAVMQARFIDRLGQSERGAGFGLVRTIYLFLSSLGSVVTGTFADLMGWPMAFGAIVGLLVFAATLLIINKLAGLNL